MVFIKEDYFSGKVSCSKSLYDYLIYYKEIGKNYNYYNYRLKIFLILLVFLGPIYIQQRLIDPEDITRTISLLLVYIIATIEIS